MALLPEISVYFRTQAQTIVQRSERGNVFLIIRDSGAETIGNRTYTSLAEFEHDEDLYDEENAQAIKDALTFNPFILYVCAIGTSATIGTALDQINGIVKTAWITVAGITTTDSTALVAWVKAQETAGKSYKAVVYNTAADSKRVVNLVNTAIEYADGREDTTAASYTPSLAAILAVCNIKRGATNYHCVNLKRVTEPANVSTAVEAGGLVLINDEDGAVRIAEGVNSMTTLGEGEGEAMKLIETVEAMDLIYEDIVYNFRNNYMGQYRNTRSTQYRFVADVNGYFDSLVQTGVLSGDEDSYCDIDVEAQRAAWEADGTDTTSWNDDVVKNHPYKRTMFLTGAVYLLQSVESLRFGITLG